MQSGAGRGKRKRQPETQSDTSRLCCWVENQGQVMRGWGQGLASREETQGHEAKIPGLDSPPLTLAVGVRAG